MVRASSRYFNLYDIMFSWELFQSSYTDTSIIQINKNCVREMILKIEQETQYSLPLRREKINSGVFVLFVFEFSQFKQPTLYCIVLLYCIKRELVNCDILLHSLFKNLKKCHKSMKWLWWNCPLEDVDINILRCMNSHYLLIPLLFHYF